MIVPVSSSIAIFSASIVSPNVVRVYPLAATPRLPEASGDWTSGSIALHSWIPLSSSVSGVYVNSTFYQPARVGIPVTSSGRIRDLRAWVELVHDYRGVGQFPAYETGTIKNAWGLQSLQLALRSPNTDFRAAHPIWNAPGAESLSIRSNVDLTGTNDRFGDFFLGVPGLLQNSYLLWAGRAVDDGPSDLLGDTTANYHEFDFDIDMRTVFWDGSSFRNPRDITYLHPSPAVTRSWIEIVSPAVSGSTEYQSPSAFVFKNGLTVASGQLSVDVTVTGVLTGTDVPWMVDSRIDCGDIVKSGAFFSRASQSVPPDGWLTSQDASVKGWQSSYVSSTIPFLFKAGRMIVRTATNQVYLMGGEGVNGGADTACSNVVATVPFFVNAAVEQVTLQTGTILQNSSLPVSLSKMGLVYYTSSAGEHVLVVGGATASGDTTGSFGVYWGTFVGADITWVSASDFQLPNGFPMVGALVHAERDMIHAVGGYTSGAFNPNVWGLNFSVVTGRPTGPWVVVGPSATLHPITSVTPTTDPLTGNHALIVGYSDSQDVAQIVQLSGVFQLAFTINSQAPVPTGTDRYPLVVDGNHVFSSANGSSSLTATFAAELFTDGTPFSIHSGGFGPVGAGVPASGLASSGTSALAARVLFVGCLSSSAPAAPQLFASTILVQAPASGEFATHGLQVGPPSVRPVYSLLDDVYSLKVFDQSGTPLGPHHGDVRGFRPGLRGTEVSGSWNLLLGMAAQTFSSISGAVVEPSVGVWFRQVRLEFVTDHGIGPSDFYPSRARKWLRPSLVPGEDGYQSVGIVSGAAAWDIGLNQTQVSQSPDYGRSVGITALTASSPASFAIQTFITGTLFDHLSASSIFNPDWFLSGNGFGTPFVPDSSMSLALTGTAEEIDAAASQELFRRTVGQTTLIPNANTMTDYLRRVNFSQTTQQVAESTNAALISGTASYFGF